MYSSHLFVNILGATAQGGGVSWWVILLVILLIALIILLWWWFTKAEKEAAPPPTKAVEPVKAVQAPAQPLTAEAFKPVEAPPAPAVVEPVKPAAPVVPDDLEIIEGIGPKIAGILKAAGVNTFKQLASMEPDKIMEIIKATGLRLADPSTWPEQARLAGEGKMDELKTLQDNLKGGRKA